MEKMKKKRYEKMKEKECKRQLVWRLEEKLGLDTKESFMHCPLWEAGTKTQVDMGNWDGIDCTYEMVHTCTYIRKWPIRKALKATGFLKTFALCFSYLFLLC